MQIKCGECGGYSNESLVWECPYCHSRIGYWQCSCGRWNDIQDYECTWCATPDDYKDMFADE